MRDDLLHSGNDETSEAIPAGEYALGVLERRNEALLVLYDTIMEIETAEETRVYEILCRNLHRLCQPSCTAIASYDPETREVALQAVETDLADPSKFSRDEFGVLRVATDADLTVLRDDRIHSCCQSPFCLLNLLPKCVAEPIRRDERGRCRRLRFVRNGLLLAVGMMYVPDGREWQNQDAVETFLSLAGVILQRNRATHELRNREQRYRSLIEATGMGYVITDAEGCVLDANREYVRMTGRERLSDLQGESVLRWTAPADRARYGQALAACRQAEGVRHLQIALQAPNGGATDVEINASPVRIEEENRILMLCSDVSVRKVMEARRAQAQKLEAIGQLAAGIAHEINTPTQFVGDNVRFLGESVQTLLGIVEQQRELLAEYRRGRRTADMDRDADPFDERAKLEYLFEEVPMAVQQTLEGVTRVSKIVSAMKEFSHPGAEEMTLVDLNLSLEKTLTVCRNEWQYYCRLETNYDSDLPLVPCFADDINQVFLNIIVNAAHAVKDVVGSDGLKKGTLSIETCYRQPWVEVHIGDTGPGIPEGIRGQVFHPFFTTKDVGKGTGQGLSLAKSAVEKHGGEITFQTEEGKGTTFTIRLPVTQSNAEDLNETRTFGQVA